jgi:hypothetical protein
MPGLGDGLRMWLRPSRGRNLPAPDLGLPISGLDLPARAWICSPGAGMPAPDMALPAPGRAPGTGKALFASPHFGNVSGPGRVRRTMRAKHPSLR